MEERPTNIKPQGRFNSNLRWQFLSNVSQAVLGGAYLLVLGRFLGVTEFGVFSVVSALVAVSGLLIELRLQDVVAKELHYLEDSRNLTGSGHRIIDLFLLDAVSKILPTLGLLLLADTFVTMSNLPPTTEYLLRLAAVGFLAAKIGNNVASGLLRVFGSTDVLAAIMTFDWGLRLISTLCIALFFGLTNPVVLFVAGLVGFFCNAALVFLALREYKQRGGEILLRKWSVREGFERTAAAKRLLLSNLGVSASDLMAKDLDITMIASFLSADKVGLYKMSKSFVQIMWRIIDPFYSALMPEIQKLWALEKYQELRELILVNSRRLLVLAIVVVAVGYFGALNFVPTLLGSSYTELPDLMLLMSVWLIFCAPLIWGIPLAVAIDRPEITVLGSLTGSAFGLIAFFNLTPRFGLVGASVAWAVTLIAGFSLTAITSVVLARRKLATYQ